MANIAFNIAFGRAVEFYNRVDTNDPASSTLVLMVVTASGIETDAALRDRDTFQEILSGTTDEAINTGYARKTLTDVELAAFTPDDVNDRADIDIPDQTWTAVAAGSAAWSDIIIGFDRLGSAANSGIVPMSIHDFVVTPDGSDITAQIAVAGFYRAQSGV